MSVLHGDGVDAVFSALRGDSDPILAEMEARADRDGFPTVGQEVGAFLHWCVEAGDVSRIFECGSGFGYSAYWMARALPPDGTIVLTEIDRDELADAQAYFAAGDLPDVARFERGDALEILDAEPGSFDLILLDHENERYREGLEVAESKIAPGGIVLADNVLHSWEFDPTAVADALESDGPAGENDSLAGVVEYLRYATSHPTFATCLLPLGEGICASVRTAGE